MKSLLFLLLVFVALAYSQDTKRNIDLNENKYRKPSEVWKTIPDSIKKRWVDGWKDFIKTTNHPIKDSYKPKDGFVPNEQTAIKIAEAVWLPIYGDGIYEDQPFVAVLIKNNTVWRVMGTLPPGFFGGTPFCEIRKSDGKILQVEHGK